MAGYFELVAVLIFAFTYYYIIKNYSKKSMIVWTSVLILFLLTIIKPLDALKAINWNVLGIYFGMLFILKEPLLKDIASIVYTAQKKEDVRV